MHVPLNEDFEKLDSHVELRDAEASREKYAPETGSKFLATDTGTVYNPDDRAKFDHCHRAGNRSPWRR